MVRLLRLAAGTSEFWGVLISLIGEAVVKAGVMDQDTYNRVLVPLLTYCAMRLVSKAAQRTVPK